MFSLMRSERGSEEKREREERVKENDYMYIFFQWVFFLNKIIIWSCYIKRITVAASKKKSFGKVLTFAAQKSKTKQWSIQSVIQDAQVSTS